MSFITRRALSTLIPPKVASPSAISSAPNAARMQRMIKFYEKLPRGPAPEVQRTGLLGRYEQKHWGGKNASAKPLVHAIIFLLIVGYYQHYTHHFRFHKNNAH